jgi:hypothetical protein
MTDSTTPKELFDVGFYLGKDDCLNGAWMRPWFTVAGLSWRPFRCATAWERMNWAYKTKPIADIPMTDADGPRSIPFLS